MCSINWTKSRGHILFHKILSKRSPWALKDEEPCLFYCTDTPNSLGAYSLRLSQLCTIMKTSSNLGLRKYLWCWQLGVQKKKM